MSTPATHTGMLRAAVTRLVERLAPADRWLAERLSPVEPGLPVRYRITPVTLDTALRYGAVIDLVRPLYRPGIDILEVGSGSGGITDFLAVPVVGVDSAFERTADRATPHLTPVVAEADALPFDDGSFDLVLTVEMLEHIPAERRDGVLSELFRVVRPGGRVVVTFPADASAARLDRELNDRFRSRYGTDHPWVAEHIREGVPSTEEVVAQARRLIGERGTVGVRKHDPARSWLFHQSLYSAHRWYRPAALAGLHSRSGATLLFRALRHARGAAYYRSIVVVDRRV
jgi:SAM-dependent methyltransferase